MTLRPSFGEKDAIYAYRTEIAWDAAASCLVFREGERHRCGLRAVRRGRGAEPVRPHLSRHQPHGQHRLITVSRPTITGEMYGILTTLLAGRGSLLTPIAAPIAFLPIRNVAAPTFGRIAPSDANYAAYRKQLRRTIDEPFALFVSA